ncbi:MAG: DUF4105 domain-containing protein [Saprospiraceae bacterium]|nr:DUF4105 domain-containing protein [Saprospiraceae bacterium]
MKYLLIHFFFLWISTFLYGQTTLPSISLLTCSPGKEIYSIYGHNAIRVRDSVAGTDYVFNYGTFDFNTPGFTLKFMRGKLPYLLSVTTYDRFLMEYHYLRRDVREQILGLDSVQTYKIIDFLRENYKPENRAYAYDFFFDNCATRLRDVIEYGCNTDLDWGPPPSATKSFRQLIKEYQQVWPWLNFGVDLIIGAKADRPASLRDQMFLPDYLASAARQAKIFSVPLVRSSADILVYEQYESHKLTSIFTHPVSVFLILVMLEVYFLFSFVRLRQKTKILAISDRIWFSLLLICVVVMGFMWWGTDHLATKNNWNILWALTGLVFFNSDQQQIAFRKPLAGLMIMVLLICMANAVPGLSFLPQFFHPAVILICTITGLKIFRKYFLESISLNA